MCVIRSAAAPRLDTWKPLIPRADATGLHYFAAPRLNAARGHEHSKRQPHTARDGVESRRHGDPEDAPLEDIQHLIYVRQKIQQGLDDVEAGRVISHEEVKQRLENWPTK